MKKLDFREVNGKTSKYSYSGSLFEVLCDDYNCSLQSITLPDSIKLINLAITNMKPSETGFLELNCASDAKFFFCTYDVRFDGSRYAAFSNIVSNDPAEVLQSVKMTSAWYDQKDEQKGYEAFLKDEIASRLKINGKEMPDVKSCMSIIHDNKYDKKTYYDFVNEATKFHESIGIKKGGMEKFLYGKEK